MAATHLFFAKAVASPAKSKRCEIKKTVATPFIPPKKPRFDNAVLTEFNHVVIKDKEMIQKLQDAMSAYYNLKILYVYQIKDVPNKYYAGITYKPNQDQKMRGIATFEVIPASSTTWGDVFNAMTGTIGGPCRPDVAAAWDYAQVGMDIAGSIPNIANTPVVPGSILCTDIKSFQYEDKF